MTEEQIKKWMHEKIRRDGFSNATSLAESFMQAHHITDVLDPDFSRSLDVSFKVVQEVRDQQATCAAR